MAKPPSPQTVRLTIAVTPEVHAVFSQMAQITGGSISKCMGEWLGDTIEGAQFMVHTMAKAKTAPKMVIQEMQSFTVGMREELDQLLAKVRADEAASRKAAPGSGDARAPRGRVPPSPRSVIRGGKSRQGRAQARENPGGEA